MTLTEDLTSAIVAFEYDNLSAQVVADTKLHILDGIGVGLNGSLLEPLFDPMMEIVQRWGGEGVCSVYRRNFTLPARYAAFINSVVMISCPYQETHRASVGHPYDVVLPTALAVSEEHGASGKDVIAAVVAGYEAFVRLATAINPSALERGIQTTGTMAPLSAAVTYGKLIGLDPDQMRHAINHGVHFGGGSLVEAHGAKPYFGVMVGTNTEKGFFAVELAKAGVVGADTILEGGATCDKGFLQAYSDKYDESLIRDGLGERLGIQDTGFSFHYVASFSRTPIDALLDIVNENGLTPDDVESVTVKLTHVLHNFVNRRIEGATGRQAHYYIPFHMALTLMFGAVDMETLTSEYFERDDIRALMDRVTVTEDLSLDADFERNKAITAVIVELQTKDGRQFSKRRDNWRGDPEFPATKEDIEQKFRRITKKAIPADVAEQIIELVDGLETLESFGELGKLIQIRA
ncbi:MAG: MmgE/PrpD family protein [Alphaproteobacteria bacterium]|nr:MmgE/PrpD family protein [Alphaproteobacteria bacterium]